MTKFLKSMKNKVEPFWIRNYKDNFKELFENKKLKKFFFYIFMLKYKKNKKGRYLWKHI